MTFGMYSFGVQATKPDDLHYIPSNTIKAPLISTHIQLISTPLCVWRNSPLHQMMITYEALQYMRCLEMYGAQQHQLKIEIFKNPYILTKIRKI